MNVEAIWTYCLNKKGAREDFPFDEETLVFKVMGKIFVLIPLEKIPLQINVKCNPGKAIELRERFDNVQPGWYMNKNYWNTIIVDDNIGWSDLKEWIDHSYDEVVNSLTKPDREKLKKF